MKIKAFFLVLFCLTFSTYCFAGSKLINPDGFYYVSNNGIFKIQTQKRDKDGDYFIHFYLSLSDDLPGIHLDQLTLVAWWYPSYQQWHATPYVKFPKRPECSGLFKKGATWSKVLVPDNKIRLYDGNTCSGYNFKKEPPPNRKPIKKACKQITVRPHSCEFQCTGWYDRKQYEEHYLIRNWDDALSAYQRLNLIKTYGN